jgi:hypothetical protein
MKDENKSIIILSVYPSYFKCKGLKLRFLSIDLKFLKIYYIENKK